MAREQLSPACECWSLPERLRHARLIWTPFWRPVPRESLRLGPYPPPHDGVQSNLVAIRTYCQHRTALGRTDESNLQAMLELYQPMLGE
jgi:hypothetical protein